jgi:hypothetical protein
VKVEITDTPLDQAVAAIREKLAAPLFHDHFALASQQSAPAAIKVKVPSKQMISRARYCPAAWRPASCATRFASTRRTGFHLDHDRRPREMNFAGACVRRSVPSMTPARNIAQNIGDCSGRYCD